MRYAVPVRYLLSVLLCLIGTIPSTDAARGHLHAIHMSLCEITYNADTHGLEMTFKLFTDDVEQALEAEGTGRLHLGEKNEQKEAGRYLARYLEKNFKIQVNNKWVVWKYIGKEVESDVLWLYAEGTEIPPLKTVSITNTILTQIFDDQSNMVHVKTGKQKRVLLLNQAKPSDSVEF